MVLTSDGCGYQEGCRILCQGVNTCPSVCPVSTRQQYPGRISHDQNGQTDNGTDVPMFTIQPLQTRHPKMKKKKNCMLEKAGRMDCLRNAENCLPETR